MVLLTTILEGLSGFVYKHNFYTKTRPAWLILYYMFCVTTSYCYLSSPLYPCIRLRAQYGLKQIYMCNVICDLCETHRWNDLGRYVIYLGSFPWIVINWSSATSDFRENLISNRNTLKIVLIYVYSQTYAKHSCNLKRCVQSTSFKPLCMNTLIPRQNDAIIQTTFSNAFYWMKMHGFRLRFHWSLFLWFEFTIFQHWSR